VSAIKVKILLAILAVLTLLTAWLMKHDEPVKMDTVIVNKLGNAAAPPKKPYLVP
jgi:hypothetical protein